MSANRIHELYARLHAAYGPQDWWPADGPFEVIVGAVLTQRTAWRNAEQAIERLRSSGLLSVRALAEAPVASIAEAIRPAGFHRAKSRTLSRVAAFLVEAHGADPEELLSRPGDALRTTLLGLPGIGEETADAIVVYAAAQPSFVVDGYARRLLGRLGWIDGDEPYGELRALFMSSLPHDAGQLGEYHALIVHHGKAHCRATPICDGCPIRAICCRACPRTETRIQEER